MTVSVQHYSMPDLILAYENFWQVVWQLWSSVKLCNLLPVGELVVEQKYQSVAEFMIYVTCKNWNSFMPLHLCIYTV